MPSDNSNHVPTTTTTEAPKKCPAGQTGTPPNCKTPPPKTCPDGQTGTPPNCKTPPPTTQPPVTCKTGEHRYGTGCHAHSFTAPCGTGTWVPHAGHTPIQRKPCTTQQDSKTTTYTVKACTPHQAPTERYQRHKHTLGNGSDETDCHRADVSHCPAGHTETGGHGAQKCVKSEITSDLQRAVGLFRVGTAKAVEAARAILNKIAEEHGEDALENAKLNEEFGKEIIALWDKAPPEVKAGAAFVAAAIGCAGLVAVAYKSTVATGGTASAAWLAWLRSPAGKNFAKDTCGLLITVGATSLTVRVLGNNDEDKGTRNDEQPTPTTQQPNDPKPDAKDEADDDKTEPKTTTTEAPKQLTLAERRANAASAYRSAAIALNLAQVYKKPQAEIDALQAARDAAIRLVWCLYGPNPDSC